MDKTCDLHLHSSASDGTLSPAELARAAREAGVSAAALTDHNTIRGVEKYMEAASALGLEGIPGVELACDYKDREVHILGLFLPRRSWDVIRSWLAGWEEGKRISNRLLEQRLRAAGIAVSLEEMAVRYPGSRINRVHFARELCRLGVCADIRRAFAEYLGEDGGYYTPAPRPTAEEALRAIRSWGGVPVLAHPPINVSREEIPAYLAWARERGAAAAEVYYSGYDRETHERMKRLCREAGLRESGGSDFHGANKPDIHIGTGKGNLHIPYEICEKLRSEEKKWNDSFV